MRPPLPCGKLAHMDTRLRPVLLALLASLPLFGCAELNKLLASVQVPDVKPTVSFVRADLRDVTLEGLTLDGVFKVENPHKVGISLARVSYQLGLEGKTVLAGSPPAGLQIAAGASSEVVLPAKIAFAALADGLQAALAKRQVAWRASGELGLDTPVGVIALPLSAEGKLDLPEPPSFSMGAPRVEGLSFTGARLVVPLVLKNPNAFPIPGASASADLFVAGAAVGKARQGAGATVPAKGEQTLDLGLEVKFLEAGAAVARALSSGEAQIKLDGALEVAGAKFPVALEKTAKLGK